MNDTAEPQSALLANIMHFARILRATGLPIGPGRVIEAVRAVEAVGLTNKTDFYWTLHAVFVNRHDQRDLFDQAFRLFWRDPELIERMMALLLPQARPDIAQARPEMSRRPDIARRWAVEPVFTTGRRSSSLSKRECSSTGAATAAMSRASARRTSRGRSAAPLTVSASTRRTSGSPS